MANDDLLQQFKKLLEENTNQLEQNFQKRQEENNKQLRLEIREDTKAEIKSEVAPLHERMDTQYKNLTSKINTVEQNLRLEIKESEKNILEQVKPFADVILDHDTQIEELQKAVGLRPKH
jgi:hypothetical protein